MHAVANPDFWVGGGGGARNKKWVTESEGLGGGARRRCRNFEIYANFQVKI